MTKKEFSAERLIVSFLGFHYRDNPLRKTINNIKDCRDFIGVNKDFIDEWWEHIQSDKSLSEIKSKKQ